MATSVIDPDNDTGTDYLSLNAWVTGESGDQGGAACIANCRSTSGSYDTGGAVVLNYNPFTNFTGYVTIQPLSDTYRHDGTLDGNTSNFVVQNGASTLINCESSGNIVIEGIALEATRLTGAVALRCKSTSAQGDSWLLGNLAVGEIRTGVYIRDDGDHFVINNIIISDDATMAEGFTMRSGGGDQCCYNNTFIGPGNYGTGIYDAFGGSGSNWRVYNNIVQGCDTDYDCSRIDSSGGNISQDATSPQTGLRSITLTFADSSNDDYHLASGDTDAIGAGTDLDGDSYYAVTEDIDQDSRDATAPDIGADEYIVSGVVKDVTDTGGGSTEAVTIASALSIADTGGGTEGALGPAVTLSVTDTSSGSDEPLLAIAIPVSDAGTGSETLGFSVLALVADLIQGFDATAISATIPVSEVGAGADEASVLGAALKLVADSASGADTLALAVSAGVVEAGTGAEALNLSAVVTIPDSATGDEALILATAAIKLVADVGAGSDAITIPTVTLSVVDTGVGSDVPTIDVVLSVADTGSGNDIADVLAAVLKSVADTGGGTEALSVNVSAEVPDAAVGSDALSIGALVAVIEAAGGADVVTKTEPGTGVRSIEFTFSGKSVVFTLAAKSTTFTLQ